MCRINPTGELYFDGMTLGPYDVLFVKLKRLMLEGRTPGTTNALRYQRWKTNTVSQQASQPACLLHLCLQASLQGNLCSVDFALCDQCTVHANDTHAANGVYDLGVRPFQRLLI